MDSFGKITAPACDICGGGEMWDGFPVWQLSDPKIAEHARHDTAPVWDRSARNGRGAWVERNSAEGQRVLKRHRR
jgi:hypothetical protein